MGQVQSVGVRNTTDGRAKRVRLTGSTVRRIDPFEFAKMIGARPMMDDERKAVRALRRRLFAGLV